MKICVYGASSKTLAKKYYEDAFELGRLLALSGHSLVFGGGRDGLMGACAEGLLSEGGHGTGIAPRFFDEPGILMTDEMDFIFTDTMSERKKLMEDTAEAFIALPGGIGTYEEFFETLTLKQLGRHNKPIALINTLNYYTQLLRLLNDCADGGFMGHDCLELFGVFDTPAEALRYVESREAVTGSVRRITDYHK